jgi:hypothetical protein
MLRPKLLLLNVNGSGQGHLNRCLSYSRRLKGSAGSTFFSLASAIEIIESMGFDADYFISHYWTDNSSYVWNCELALRFGMMLERVQPDVIVFDGTWPFQGFLTACKAYQGKPKLVWSKRGLIKEGVEKTPVSESFFDLIIEPGEVGDRYQETLLSGGSLHSPYRLLAPRSSKKIHVPPVCILNDDQIYTREEARAALGLSLSGKYILCSLGPGNLKDVSSIGSELIGLLVSRGYEVVWARAPISVKDAPLPNGVIPISVYPLVQYMRAFDGFIGAAGYNTCCEVVQAGIPSLLIPNTLLADDQTSRAQALSAYAPVIVSSCETPAERSFGVSALFELVALAQSGNASSYKPVAMNGADLAAKAILALARGAR